MPAAANQVSSVSFTHLAQGQPAWGAVPYRPNPQWPSDLRDAVISPRRVPQARGDATRNQAVWPESLNSFSRKCLGVVTARALAPLPL